ncbi:hypothetical protein MNB_SM-3-1180 [hydrothermal vent metagenome]|uniref:Uncharacterized protein n=1 Tax=hydrothermal vent metagenome TaxID=652676 RepID=A0A1W1D373_9ZZZZ
MCLLCSITLYAKDYTLKLYETLSNELFESVPVIVYADSKSAIRLQKSEKFYVSHSCNEDVDFLVGSHFGHLSPLCQNKPLFATTKRAYKKYKNAFGAFYWTKGRPQIHFNPKVLKQFHFVLPQNLKRFQDE